MVFEQIKQMVGRRSRQHDQNAVVVLDDQASIIKKQRFTMLVKRVPLNDSR